MHTNNDAILDIDLLIQDRVQFFLSPREVSNRLDMLSKALFAKRLRVKIRQLEQEYNWGALGDPEPTVKLQTGQLSEEVNFVVLGDCYPTTEEEQAILPKLKVLANALWGEDLRPSGGLAWKRESVRSLLPKSIERLRGSESAIKSLAVLYGDLDNFKKLNDNAGHEKGDEAIRFVNRVFHDSCLRYGGLPFHPSGDEYYLILPNRDLVPMMAELYELRQRIKAQKFVASDGNEHTIDLTLGMHLFDGETSMSNIEEAIKKAEQATKAPNNIKRRGKISISNVGHQEYATTNAKEFAQLGAVIIRRKSRTSCETFVDPRLALIELVARKCNEKGKELQQPVEELAEWLDLKTTSDFSLSYLLKDLSPRPLPKIALALAVASGVLSCSENASNVVELCIHFASNSSAKVMLNGSHIWGDQLDAEDCDKVEILKKEIEPSNPLLIGLQVGLSEKLLFSCGIEFPTDLLTHLVLIDDRPNVGGGLPDFWQAAVAQVFQHAASGSAKILTWGVTAENSETVRRLKLETDWPIDEIASVAEIESEVVRTLRPLLKANLHLVSNAKDVVELLYEFGGVESNVTSDSLSTKKKSELMRRNVLECQTLGQADGIRCRTAAQAFPIIIDVLRRTELRQSADDAFQTLKELIAFKLVLESPSVEMVPTYFKAQDEDIRRYADLVLVKPDSRIRKALEHTNQIEAFMKELQACYIGGKNHRSTRRALLSVPNIEKNDGVLGPPEGLTSTWASPRVDDDGCIVDWVFVWRTVEAFVGFPYSLYGSIKLAQTLLEELSVRVGTQLRLGHLTYIALSLHMRVGGVHSRIAKRIVDLSSD